MVAIFLRENCLLCILFSLSSWLGLFRFYILLLIILLLLLGIISYSGFTRLNIYIYIYIWGVDETPTIRTLAPHHKNYTSSTNQTRRTLLEKQGRAHKRCTPVDPRTWMCRSGTTSTNLHTAAVWGHGM